MCIRDRYFNWTIIKFIPCVTIKDTCASHSVTESLSQEPVWFSCWSSDLDWNGPNLLKEAELFQWNWHFFWQLLDVSWYKNCVVQFGIFSLFSYFSPLGPLKDAYSWFSCQFSLCSINFSSSIVTCSLPTTPLIRIGFIGPLLAGRLCGSSNRTHLKTTWGWSSYI